MLRKNPTTGRLEYLTIGSEPMFNNPTINSSVADPATLSAAIASKAAKKTAHLIPADQVNGVTDENGAISGGNTVFSIAGEANLTEEIECYNAGARAFNFVAENVDGSVQFTMTSPPLEGNELIFIYTSL